MTQPTSDADWLYPEPVDPEADTERPDPAAVWRCGGEDCEPTQHASLIEATCEPPTTPEAEVYGGGELLARSSSESALWVFTARGMERIERECAGDIRRSA
jgi:hypothetical protein